MRFITLFLFTIISLVSFSQNKFDTLCFGSKKYPLQKVRIFHESSQRGPVYLPSEYKEIEVKDWKSVPFFEYKKTDSIIGIENDDDGNLIMTSRWEGNCDTLSANKYYLSCLLDTIVTSYEDLRKIVPYVKSNNRKINFTACSLDQISNGKIRKHNIYYLVTSNEITDWDFFSFWGSYQDKAESKFSTLILRDFYYIRGKETYYLNRKFIILV